MFSVQAQGAKLCDGMPRREVLRAGGLGVCGLSLSQLLAPQLKGSDSNSTGSNSSGSNGSGSNGSGSNGTGGRAKSCIVLFLMGGPPQHSTWDPKPLAPDNVRGEIAPIATNVPGMQFGELMPKLAQQADKLALLRAMTTYDNAHSSSGYYMLTGRPHVPMNAENVNPGVPNDWPNWGAVVQKLTQPRGQLPGAVRLPSHFFNNGGSIWPGQDAGMLGRSYDPWMFRCLPASPDYQISEFQLPENMSLDRLASRRELMRTLESSLTAARSETKVGSFGNQQERAYGLLASSASRGAFDLSLESPETRARYGMSQFGQSCLLARRLVEEGVRLVQVNWYRGPEEPFDSPCWDSHGNETQRLKNVLLPPMDMAFSSLVEDLSERGMLDETLVVCMGEFGRSPKMNANAGRDHWGSVFSVALAGGGVRGGVIHGASDEIGGYPKQGVVKPEDLTATIFHCLGFAPETEFHDPLGRPYAISRGRPVEQILG